MADILYFPGPRMREWRDQQPDLGGESLRGAADILLVLSARLMVCPRDRETRLAVIDNIETRLKLVELCLDLARIAEQRR